MKYRIDYTRKNNPGTKPGEIGRRIGIEIAARTPAEASELADREIIRRGYHLRNFQRQEPRKI